MAAVTVTAGQALLLRGKGFRAIDALLVCVGVEQGQKVEDAFKTRLLTLSGRAQHSVPPASVSSCVS